MNEEGEAMRHLKFSILIVVGLVMLVELGSSFAARGGEKFDGKWTIKLTSEGCPVGTVTGTFDLSDSKLSGTVAAGTRGVYKVSGTILPSGVLEKFYLQGARYFVRITGSISGDRGTGSWEVASGECGGTFSLVRIVSD